MVLKTCRAEEALEPVRVLEAHGSLVHFDAELALRECVVGQAGEEGRHDNRGIHELVLQRCKHGGCACVLVPSGRVEGEGTIEDRVGRHDTGQDAHGADVQREQQGRPAGAQLGAHGRHDQGGARGL